MLAVTHYVKLEVQYTYFTMFVTCNNNVLNVELVKMFPSVNGVRVNKWLTILYFNLLLWY